MLLLSLKNVLLTTLHLAMLDIPNMHLNAATVRLASSSCSSYFFSHQRFVISLCPLLLSHLVHLPLQRLQVSQNIRAFLRRRGIADNVFFADGGRAG